MSDTEPAARPAATEHHSRELKAGRILDERYEILERIGAGGMGVVYKARRLMLDDTVAVKQLAPISSSRWDPSRFLLEARAAAHIRHPNVVEIFDFGNPEDGVPYIVMEHLEGPTLEQTLRGGPMPVARALEVLAPICAAVEAGHRRGVIHRDLKPANIILTTSDDGREVVKVLDFGLARFDTSDETRLTQTGTLVGTAQYMSPEQARGETVLPASDVFALGILLYEMVTGVVPFRGKSPVMTAVAISRGMYQPANDRVPNLPAPLVHAIDLALAQDPAARPKSPEQLARLAEAGLPRNVDAPPRPSVGGAPSIQTFGESMSQVPALDHFVGRERQLRRLNEEYEKSAAGNGRVVLVAGEAGIGKTRLVERFLEQLAQRQPAVILRGRFFDYEGSRTPPFESFLRMLRSDSGQEHDASVQQVLETRGDLGADSQRWRAFTALAEAFAARAGTLPLILVFDDIHWATGADLDLIHHLHRALANRGTLVLATARDDGSLSHRDARATRSHTELASWLERLAAKRAHAVLTLRPFGEQEVREWFERGFGNLRMHPRDLKRVTRATGANPYFLVEVARHLLETETIARVSDADSSPDLPDPGWRCLPLAEVELPETVVSLVRARLRGLEPDLRELLETASVVGGELRFETLSRATGLETQELERLADEATHRLILTDRGVSPGNDLRFANETLRRVLYRDMSRQDRRNAHRRVVTALTELFADDLDRLAPILAYHHHAVANWREALTWGLRALSEALERSDHEAAEEALARTWDAVAASTSIPALERQRLDHLAGVLSRHLGRLDDAIQTLRSAQRGPDGPLGVTARLELARCHLDRGELDDALATARTAKKAAREIDDRQCELEARMFEASCLLRVGLHQETAAMLSRLLATLGDQDPPSLHSMAHRERAWALLKSGAFPQAQEHARRAMQLAREAGDLLAQHNALSALAAVLAESGDHQGSLPYHRRTLELARRLSLRRREAIDLANLGECFYETCDPEQALEHFHAALRIFVEIGDRACEADCRVNVGRAMLAHGDVAGALAILERGRTLCESVGRTEYAGIASLQIGEANLRTNDVEAASASFARAQDHFAQIDSHHLWRAHYGRAKAERAAGRHGRALEFARAAAERAAAQRDRLPVESDASGFDQASSGVFELLETIQPPGHTAS